MEDEEEVVVTKKVEEPPPRRRPKKLVIPRRIPSVVVPPREVEYVTPDKTSCKTCPCYPKDDPYAKPKKLNPCQKNPLTLYELAAAVVDKLKFPDAFNWCSGDVAEWMEDVVGLPEYKACILDNRINGRRLLLLDDASHLPAINIHNLEHIKMITAKIRELFSTEFVLFCRSIGLPPRYPLTHCTFFKSRTGPTWGIRKNWSRCDILRWMKIVNPAPVYRDHWDLVWYLPPDFPRTLFGRIGKRTTHEYIPHYKAIKHEPCREYQAPRKFILQPDLPEDQQMIWMEHRVGSPIPKENLGKYAGRLKKKDTFKPTKAKKSRLDPPRISLTGLAGNKLLLARRLMPKKKFSVY